MGQRNDELHSGLINSYRRASDAICLSRQLTPVPSAFTGIWLIKLDASKGGFAGGGAVVGGAGVVIGSSEPS